MERDTTLLHQLAQQFVYATVTPPDTPTPTLPHNSSNFKVKWDVALRHIKIEFSYNETHVPGMLVRECALALERISAQLTGAFSDDKIGEVMASEIQNSIDSLSACPTRVSGVATVTMTNRRASKAAKIAHFRKKGGKSFK